MKLESASAMRRATELVRAGDLASATTLIQSSLSGSQPSKTQPFAQPSPADVTEMGSLGLVRGRGLRETLASLATKKLVPRGPASAVPEPTLAEGARFDAGTFSCASGSRDYRVYVPNLKTPQPAGMIVMLHGCTQSPVDFANGTDMNRLAEEHGLIVVYPAQSRAANMQSCWNWFGTADQARGAGEPAILAGMAEQVRARHDVPSGKVFVAGLSAGAAMAVILGRTYPDIFSAVGAHSGLPYKSAHDVPSAFAAMGGGRKGPGDQSAANSDSLRTIVFHGTADATVNAANGQQIADEARPAGTELLDQGSRNKRSYSRTTVLSATGQSVMEHWQIEGLGHAWSGGQASGSYTDPAGPDASAEMVRFFLETPKKGE